MKEIRNFFEFLLNLISQIFKGKEVYADISEQEQRLRICYTCDSLSKGFVAEKLKQPRCLECGCFVKEKTKYKFEMCPIDKW